MFLVFISSGLFLGWSLGANDSANVFGSAVGSRMVRFRTAALIISVFVILGAVIQGGGASHTLGKLGAVSTMAASFTVAFSAALTVFVMTRYNLPVSTSQAIVGAIIGWNLYTGNATDYNSLSKIVSAWIMSPILGGVFAVILLLFFRLFIRLTKIHLLKLDASVRIGLVLVGAFGSFSLGANNIANVMGVFIHSAPVNNLDFGLFELNGVQQLFLLGGIAIAVGAVTYSRKIMETVGNKLLELSAEASLVVVLSHSLVLFVFSSHDLQQLMINIGLPPIPLVPVSSSQAIVGAILGIGLLKGGRGIKFGVLGEIAIGWISTPLAAGIITFFGLFFINNVFMQDVGVSDTTKNRKVYEHIHQNKTAFANDDVVEVEVKQDTKEKPVNMNKVDMRKPTMVVLLAVLLFFTILLFFLYRKYRIKYKTSVSTKEKMLTESYLENIESEERNTQVLNKIQDIIIADIKLQLKQEAVTMADKLEVYHLYQALKEKYGNDENVEQLKLFSATSEDFNQMIEGFKNRNEDFVKRLLNDYPQLDDEDIILLLFVRLKLKNKDIERLYKFSASTLSHNKLLIAKKIYMKTTDELEIYIKQLDRICKIDFDDKVL